MSDIRIHKLANLTGVSKPVAKPKTEEKEPAETAKAPTTNYKSADQVLDHLSSSAAFRKESITSAKTAEAPQGSLEDEFLKEAQAYFGVNTSKSLDNSGNTIGASVNKAIEAMFKYEEAFIKEFGMSGDKAQDSAIMAFGQKYLV